MTENEFNEHYTAFWQNWHSGFEPHPDHVRLYWEALKDFSLDAFTAACHQLAIVEKHPRMPTVGDVVAFTAAFEARAAMDRTGLAPNGIPWEGGVHEIPKSQRRSRKLMELDVQEAYPGWTESRVRQEVNRRMDMEAGKIPWPKQRPEVVNAGGQPFPPKWDDVDFDDGCHPKLDLKRAMRELARSVRARS